ncbi:hypothetical protein GA0070216_107247 [Micromonospora matsumotoense]|uniref:Uncharacterized protein n=1 Tax=Micromonospora matsumotoense TaxID=121616 RepID=A0A1C4YWV1_9ACTN|nr:hypothetical protein [Micromonospora matsumotoense]SCF25170.1 hypothetical protein GA0070216_107247 [Micromonospora matsumotoense]
MLPAAPTSPLWWVARWWSRLLTGLAVAIAFAVASPALPGSALFDPGPAAAALPVDASLSFPVAGAPAAPTGRPAGIRSGAQETDPAGAVTADRAVAVVLAVPAADRALALDVPAADRAAVVLAVPTADRRDAVVPAGVARSAPPPAVPAGRTPVATAPRAPPAG